MISQCLGLVVSKYQSSHRTRNTTHLILFTVKALINNNAILHLKISNFVLSVNLIPICLFTFSVDSGENSNCR